MENNKSKLYLITGGTGFLGSHLIPLLLDSGHKVRIFARTPENNYNNESVQFYEGSVLDEESVRKAAEGVDGIFHLAAQVIHSRLPAHADAVRASAVVGTMNVMRAASKVKCRVVYASTSGTVGCSRTPTTANDTSPYATDIVKHWPYYLAKIEAEIKAKKFAKEKGVELVIIRPTMMFGPGDDRFRSTHLILSFLNRRIPVLFDGGMSLVDIRDAAKAFKVAMESAPPGESYLLASQNLTLKQFFETLQSISGVPAPKLRLPYPITYSLVFAIDQANRKILRKWDPGFDPVKAEMAKHFWYISSEKAKKDLHFEPIPYVKTLKDTINWINTNKPETLKHKINLKAKL